MDKLLNNMPNYAPDGPLGTEKKGAFVHRFVHFVTRLTLKQAFYRPSAMRWARC